MPIQIGPITIGPPDTPPAAPAEPAPAAAPDTTARDQILADFARQHRGNPIGTPYPVMPTAAEIAAGADPDNPPRRYTFPDGATLEITDAGQISKTTGPVSGGATAPGGGGTAGWTDVTQVRNADQTITYYGKDPTDGQFKQIPGLPTSAAATSVQATGDVSAPTSQPYIVQRDASGALKVVQNPNYTPPTPAQIASNTTDPYIVTRDASGALRTQPNPNYQRPAPSPVATNTTDPYIVVRDPTTGAMSTQPNPNYQKPAPSVVSAPNTTDQYIVVRDPSTGSLSTQPNPNYQKPAPATVATSADQPFIVQRDPTTGAVSQVPNPNYVAPKPSVVQTGTQQPFITTMDPTTGQLTSVPNPSYLPSDPARLAAQITQQADAQQQALNQQVQAGTLTADQAAKQFDQWWQTNVEPQKAQIQQAQQSAALDLATKQQALASSQQQQQLALAQFGQNAGQQAVQNQMALLPYRVGPGFGTAVNQIAGAFANKTFPGNLDLGSAVTFQLPNMDQVAQQGAAKALQGVSAAAHSVLGLPPPTLPQVNPVDVTAGLNESAYQFGNATPLAAGVGVPAPAVASAPATADWYTQWQQRQAADAAAQQLQAQIWPPYAFAGG